MLFVLLQQQSPAIINWDACIYFNKKNSFDNYSIVKGSSVDLGFNSKIVQIRLIVKAVSTKISKNLFLRICQYFDISERK